MLEGYWYVAREYSGHAAKNNLLKSLSCGFLFEQEALNWLDFCKSQEPKCDKEFFVYFRKEEWDDKTKVFMQGEKPWF